jgi:hypothetical protein
VAKRKKLERVGGLSALIAITIIALTASSKMAPAQHAAKDVIAAI